MHKFAAAILLSVAVTGVAQARLVRLRVERREVVLAGKLFGLAGAYEKLVGKADFALDPALPQNQIIVDLPLAPRNEHGEVEFSADFYLLKPVDPTKGNGQLFYEVGNRGGKGMLATFQKGSGSTDPKTEAEFGDGSLMRQGFALLWVGWQWDVPDGRMRIDAPIATDAGRPITGLVRANFIPSQHEPTARLADRNHRAYLVLDPANAENVMTVRDERLDSPQVIPRARWRFVDGETVALDGGFEPGRIYDVVYRAKDPRVAGTGLAATRDIASFFKYEKGVANPMPTIQHALAWGRSQSGRFLRHFLYEGFNEDEKGRRVFDGVLALVGGAGRGSFNHRFAQASRDALEHINMLFPVDMFPFTDVPETDPETGTTDALLTRAEKSGTVPKIFYVLTNSEYFNRGGSLVHTDPTGTKDVELPPSTRLYLMSSSPHMPAPFPPVPNKLDTLLGLAPRNTLDYLPVVRALFVALDRWVTEDTAPPPSRYPHIADGTLVPRESGGWPAIPGFLFPPPQLVPYRLDFGPNWKRGIIDNEPPKIGKPFVVRVPAVDGDGNDRAGVRVPELVVPLATHTGWNYRHPSIGAPRHLAGEIGSYIPFARTQAERQKTRDQRLSIEERYPNKETYVGKIAAAGLELVRQSYMLPQDLPDVIDRAAAHWDWAIGADTKAPPHEPQL